VGEQKKRSRKHQTAKARRLRVDTVERIMVSAGDGAAHECKRVKVGETQGDARGSGPECYGGRARNGVRTGFERREYGPFVLDIRYENVG